MLVLGKRGAFEHDKPGGLANDHDKPGGDDESNGGLMEARVFKEEWGRTFNEWRPSFQGIMGFHTRHRDARRKIQNSGVTLKALTPSFASAKVTYYGRIVDMFELDYYGQFKVVLFKYPYVSDKHYVMKIIPRDLFRISDDLESNTPIINAREPCEFEMIPSLPNNNGEVDLVRNDLQATIIDMTPNMFAKQHREKDAESECDEYREDVNFETS
ncbi:hypothetical protein AHAS_Ahas17G0217600 [Arachis hypogaea]